MPLGIAEAYGFEDPSRLVVLLVNVRDDLSVIVPRMLCRDGRSKRETGEDGT
jgi:hypothetical protein